MSKPSENVAANDAMNPIKTPIESASPAANPPRRPVLSERVDEIFEFSDSIVKPSSADTPAPGS